MPKIGLSTHAIDRYRERVHPALSWEEAKGKLSEGLTQAICGRVKTMHGQLQYQLPDCMLIVKESPDGLLAVTAYPLKKQGRNWDELLASMAEEATRLYAIDAEGRPNAIEATVEVQAPVLFANTSLKGTAQACIDADMLLSQLREKLAIFASIPALTAELTQLKATCQKLRSEAGQFRTLINNLRPYLPKIPPVVKILGAYAKGFQASTVYQPWKPPTHPPAEGTTVLGLYATRTLAGEPLLFHDGRWWAMDNEAIEVLPPLVWTYLPMGGADAETRHP